MTDYECEKCGCQWREKWAFTCPKCGSGGSNERSKPGGNSAAETAQEGKEAT